MATSDYTLIAGPMRMPRVRPLELVSRSIGREWALLPPSASFRTEIKALYAAMMRTVCLSATAIRLMCRWDPQTLRELPEPGPRRSPTPADQKNPIPLGLRHPERAVASRNSQWNMLAGGACAVSGVAIIAWLLASHPRQQALPTPSAPAEVTLNAHPVQRAQQAERTSRADAIREAHDHSGHVADATRVPDARSHARDDLTAQASAGSTAQSTPPAHVDTARTTVARNESARTSPVSRETRREKHEAPAARSTARRTAHATYRSSEIARLPGGGVHASVHVRHDTPPASIHRARPAVSAAGSYSPPAPSSSSHVDNDYASVKMSAATHLRDVPPAPIARGRVDTDNTGWVNHLSQRRITDVPDQFSK